VPFSCQHKLFTITTPTVAEKPAQLTKMSTELSKDSQETKSGANSQTHANLSDASSNYDKLEPGDSEVIFTFKSAPSSSFARLIAESTGSTASSVATMEAPEAIPAAMKGSANSIASGKSLSASDERPGPKPKSSTIVLASSAGSHESVEIDIVSDSIKVSTFTLMRFSSNFAWLGY